MDIRIDPHTLERALERGASLEEITEVFSSGFSVAAKYDRLSKQKVFPFGQERLGKIYEHKLVQLVYTIDDGIAVAVTVYVFYGSWKEGQ